MERLRSILKRQPQQEEEAEPKFLFSIDEPRQRLLEDYRINVRGWVVSKEGLVIQKVRLRNNETIHKAKFGVKRVDVAKFYSNLDKKTTMKSGFECSLEFENGPLVLEVDTGNGFEFAADIDLYYTGSKPLTLNYNPDLADQWVRHKNLLETKQGYFHEEERSIEFKPHAGDKKAVALYLPQFHPIPENDRAWGKGFTEWTNVATAEPRFVGHHAPTLPADLGFYDLRLKDTMAEQIELAKKHGIFGFSFYYYWFSGKKLLEKPLQMLLDNKDLDFNFMICWANENWTKRWDGFDKEVIVAQKYLEKDPLDFIQDVEPILLDERYIRVDGKPVLAVYRPEHLNNVKKYVEVWRSYFRKKHGLELHLVSFMSFENKNPAVYGFDAAVDFVPQGVDFKAEVFGGVAPHVDIKNTLMDPRFEGVAFDYRKIVLNEGFQSFKYPFQTYRCVMPSWDNDARKKGKGSSYYYSNPDIYAYWLDRAMKETEEGSLVFINAWNEWAEGAMLEPTKRYGHATLNRTTEVLAKHSKDEKNKIKVPQFGIKRDEDTSLAVIIHLYYPDQWPLIIKKLKSIKGHKFDLFISLQKNDAFFQKEILMEFPDAYCFVYPNRGRDVLPFVHIGRRVAAAGYTNILKLHTKKSKHRTDGGEWFVDMLDKLIPGKAGVDRIITKLTRDNAIVGPEGHYIALDKYIGSNQDDMERLLRDVYDEERAKAIMANPGAYSYFAGSMFWSSCEVLTPLFDLYLAPEDFEAENTQIDGTLAHAVERVISVVAQENGNVLYVSSKRGLKKCSPEDGDRDYGYVK